MSGRNYWIETWGCQMNEHDSEKLAGTLEGLGYSAAGSLGEADLVLLNTCAIREKAEEKVYQVLGKLAGLKRRRPEMVIGVAGCVAQLSGALVRRRAPCVDLVVGPRAAFRLPELLAEVLDRRGVIDTTLYPDSLSAPRFPAHRAGAARKAFVTVMEGCNKTCAYCVVPATRGREESRPLDSIVEEVGRLAGQGYQEVEFLGQNVNAWRDRQAGAGLGDLLRAAGRVSGIRRLRFTTSHPLHLTEKIVAAMGEVEAVCPHLHLPLQSGSSMVLQAMRRGYDRERYLKKVELLRRLVPGIALSTDVIVGFPGETEADFQETLSLVREVEFDQMFSFVFSPRPGTAAALLADPLPGQRKTERLMELQGVQREIQWRRHRELVGREFEVIVEGKSRRDPAEWAGRTACNRVVNFRAGGAKPGDLLRVEITLGGPNSLRGRLVLSGPQLAEAVRKAPVPG